MAREDKSRAMMLSKLLNDVYGDEETAVNGYPGEDKSREREKRDITRAMPPGLGTDARKVIDSIPQGSDSDYAEEEADDPEEITPINRGQRNDVPNNDMDAPVIPQRPRKPINIEQPKEGNDMVQVPKPVFDKVMAAMMGSASGNAISKSRGDDGTGQYEPEDESEDNRRMRKRG